MGKTPAQLAAQRERAAKRKALKAAGTYVPRSGQTNLSGSSTATSRQTGPKITDEPMSDQIGHRQKKLKESFEDQHTARKSLRAAMESLEELEVILDQLPNLQQGDNHHLAVIASSLNRALKALDLLVQRGSFTDKRKRKYTRYPV